MTHSYWPSAKKGTSWSPPVADGGVPPLEVWLMSEKFKYFRTILVHLLSWRKKYLNSTVSKFKTAPWSDCVCWSHQWPCSSAPFSRKFSSPNSVWPIIRYIFLSNIFFSIFTSHRVPGLTTRFTKIILKATRNIYSRSWQYLSNQNGIFSTNQKVTFSQ